MMVVENWQECGSGWKNTVSAVKSRCLGTHAVERTILWVVMICKRREHNVVRKGETNDSKQA